MSSGSKRGRDSDVVPTGTSPSPPPGSGCVQCGATTTLLLRCGHRACFACLLSHSSTCPSCGRPVQAFEGGLPDGCARCRSPDSLRTLPGCGHTVCFACLSSSRGRCPVCGVGAALVSLEGPPPISPVPLPISPSLGFDGGAFVTIDGSSDPFFAQDPSVYTSISSEQQQQQQQQQMSISMAQAQPQAMAPSAMVVDTQQTKYASVKQPQSAPMTPVQQQPQQQQQQYQMAGGPQLGYAQYQPQLQQQQQQERLPEREFDRQVVLITGASQGIGAAAAKEFALRGARVVVNYNKSKPHADAVVRYIKNFGGEATAVQADVSQEEAVKKLVKTTLSLYGRIDVLVNNAGTPGPMVPLHEISSPDWHNTMRTNLDAVFLTIHEVAPVMIKQGYGRIINVSSASVNVLPAMRSAYNASKSAVEAISKTFSKEIARHGITVNCVAPGSVRTAMMQGSIARLSHATGRMMDDLTRDLESRSAIGRFCEPEEVATAIVFLASRCNGAITGTVLEVSGGILS